LFKDLNVGKVNAVSRNEVEGITGHKDIPSYDQTKLVFVRMCYLDDDTMENIPLDEDEFNQRTALIQNSGDVPVLPSDNHEEYIKRYLDWLEKIVLPQGDGTPETDAFLYKVVQNTSMVVEEHLRLYPQNPSGKRYKYPYGRRITIVGDELAEDIPNPLLMPWRKMYYQWDAEKVPGSPWGRGVPEQLWSVNETVDVFLSRVGDLSITTSFPHIFMRLDDILALKKQNKEYTNDPLAVNAYVTTPPVISQGNMPQEFVLMVNQMLQAAERRGTNEVMTGQSPGSHASGDLVELLLRQGMIMVTGEAAKNLNELVSQIHETKVAFYKNFYTEPRFWIINGRQETINLSEVLNSIPEFQIRVKPNSNFPNQWEADLAFLLQLLKIPMPDGMPIVPRAFILDAIGQRFPELAPGGKYFIMSEIEKLGMEEFKKRQAQQQAEELMKQQIGERLKSEAINLAMGKKQGGTENVQAS
jgi:hypothetical protein